METDWTINLVQLANPQQHLLVGLLGASSTGDGTVTFQIDQNGTDVVRQTFLTFSAADTYFANQTLDLGAIGIGVPTNNLLSLSFTLSVTTGLDGASFDPNIVFGNSTLGSNPTVPEPASLLLLAVGATGMLLLKRRLRAEE